MLFNSQHLEVVSIGGGSLEEYVRMTSALQGRPEVAAIEIHLSARDEELDRSVLGAYPDRSTRTSTAGIGDRSSSGRSG